MKRFFRTPIPVRWIYHRRIWGFSSSTGKVYLTFDDGPTPELTNWILETLAKEDVKATFFCVGSNAEAHPELMERMVAEGHCVGNHTMRHENSNKTTRSDDYFTSIEETSKHVNGDLFRPPYGRLSLLRGRKILKDYKVIMWSWLSYDYDSDVLVEDILDSARKEIKAGDILVLHDNKKVEKRLKLILPELIQIIRSKGLKFDVIDV